MDFLRAFFSGAFVLMGGCLVLSSISLLIFYFYTQHKKKIAKQELAKMTLEKVFSCFKFFVLNSSLSFQVPERKQWYQRRVLFFFFFFFFFHNEGVCIFSKLSLSLVPCLTRFLHEKGKFFFFHQTIFLPNCTAFLI
eukprot:TRINITY_DN1628_c0_g1_i13.p3 TRINITY_DN1628_c0_g1~~TRINITY_DN1628_c0_g1_i13.p3  ORF type:complete len:137 (-),score=29.10 TRINITY_DN1628_c0_g1_i13:759-1169(-)